jgi:hypothetical protein
VHMGLHSMHCDAQSDKRQNKELSHNHKFSWLTLVNTKPIKPLYHIMFKHYTVFWKNRWHYLSEKYNLHKHFNNQTTVADTLLPIPESQRSF